MSRIYSAGQYEQAYLPHRLGNWMPADDRKLEATTSNGRYGTLQAKPPGARTRPIVDERGHLLPVAAAAAPGAASPPRWPSPSPALGAAPAATMGYKGIQTQYLNTNTVTIKTVEIPGCREAKYQ